MTEQPLSVASLHGREGEEDLGGLKLALQCPSIDSTHIASTRNSLAWILHEYSKPQWGGSANPTGQLRTESYMAGTTETRHECLTQDLVPTCSINIISHPFPFPNYEQLMVK